MDLSSKLLSNAVDEISKLPGIGKSTALRLALHLVNKEEGDIDNLLKSIKQLKKVYYFVKDVKVFLIIKYVTFAQVQIEILKFYV